MKGTELPKRHDVLHDKLLQAHRIDVHPDRPLIDSIRSQIDEIVERSPAAKKKPRTRAAAKAAPLEVKSVRFWGHGIRNDDGK